MGKKKSAKAPGAPTKDQHTQKLLGVRLPDDLTNAMRALAVKNYRSLTSEIRLALERYLEAAGLWPPKTD